MTSNQGSVGRESVVSLRPVTAENAGTIMRLKVAPGQEQFVASNERSLAQAHFSREAWYRAIYADEVPVGFLMLYDDPVKPEYFLWRLMIDAAYQGNGFGHQAMQHLIEHVRGRPNAKELLLSHGEGEGNPGAFYTSMGFQYTGETLHGELVMRLPVQPLSNVVADPRGPRPLTHVVLFKLNERDHASISLTAEILRGMEGKIAVLQDIEVGTNVVPSERAYDIVLITRFRSLADMEAYQVHPVHQGVLAHMREVMESAVAVDYETE
jgi:diamine N-acetyltransferase